MEKFERRLKELRLASPSADLRGRIFGSTMQRIWFAAVLGRRVAVGWAALFALATGIAGMVVSQSVWDKRPERVTSAVRVSIVESASKRNLFDLTEPAAAFLPGELTVKKKTPKEI